MTLYLYRRGNGNEGNFARLVVEITDNENPYSALKALVANDYIAGTRTRRHIAANIEVDGEAEFGVHAVVYEGPEGEQAFGAAWLTAELQPISAGDFRDCYYNLGAENEKPWTLRGILDRGAKQIYRKAA
mgnify:CR=1 FL=1